MSDRCPLGYLFRYFDRRLIILLSLFAAFSHLTHHHIHKHALVPAMMQSTLLTYEFGGLDKFYIGIFVFLFLSGFY